MEELVNMVNELDDEVVGYGKVGGGDAGRVDEGTGGNWWPCQLELNMDQFR